MLTTATFQEMETLIKPVLLAREVPLILGKPGVGKSSFWRKIAEDTKLEFLDLRLTTLDPTMLNGFLWMDEAQMKATFKTLDVFPLKDDPLPKGKKGWILHLDEFTQTPKSVEGAAFQLVLDRIVGMKLLHPKVYIVCSGNPPGQGMIAKTISTPMRTRLIHFVMQNTLKSFTDAMLNLNFHPLIINYLNGHEDDMNNFDKAYQLQTGTYACERSWEKMSNIMKQFDHLKWKVKEQHTPILTGTVGDEAGAGFYAFLQSYYAAPDIASIVQSPQGTPLPDSGAEQYAALSYLGDKVTMNNGKQVATYLQRFPEELQYIYGRILKRDKEDIMDKHFEFIDDLIAKYAD